MDLAKLAQSFEQTDLISKEKKRSKDTEDALAQEMEEGSDDSEFDPNASD